MFTTRAAAEHAAVNGLGREWDSQDCREFQGEVLSSSPREPETDAIATRFHPQATTLNVEADTDVPEKVLPDVRAHTDATEKIDDDVTVDLRTLPASHDNTPIPSETSPKNNAKQEVLVGDSGQLTTRAKGKLRKGMALRRDSHGRLRLFDPSGVEVSIQQSIRSREELILVENDPNATQKSSMSLTQENHESAYERYRTAPTSTSRDEPQNAQGQSKSLNADSTIHTYGEDDTGHVNLEFQQEPDHNDLEFTQEQDEGRMIDPSPFKRSTLGVSQDVPSQDPILPPPVYGFQSRENEPQTPAPPVNPFVNKGSVMKGHELFGATQPSSVGRAFNQSPSSSRPSPDVFNQFVTPKLPSSPLKMRDPLPLPQSSPSRTSQHVSFAGLLASTPTANVRAGLLSSSFQPRAYRSMKESQERRKAATDANDDDPDTDSDDSVMSIEIAVRRQAVDKSIQRELSAVGLKRKQPQSSSRPSPSIVQSSNHATVEVPSTSPSRRRSPDETYLAQCSGYDARDTQGDAESLDRDADDIVADSQLVSSQPHPSDHDHHDITKRNLLPHYSSVDEIAVPETSPPSARDQIRPMADIASFSFNAEDERINMDDIAGFTQDDDFYRAIGRLPSPQSPRQSTAHEVPAPQSNVPTNLQSKDLRQEIEKQGMSVAAAEIVQEPRNTILEVSGNSSRNRSEDPANPPVGLQNQDGVHVQSEEHVKDVSEPHAAAQITVTPGSADNPVSLDECQIPAKAPSIPGPYDGKITDANGFSPRAISQHQGSCAPTPAPNSSDLSSALSTLQGFTSDDEPGSSEPRRNGSFSSPGQDYVNIGRQSARQKTLNPVVKRNSKRKAKASLDAPTRVSKRQSVRHLRDSSDDPLALPANSKSATKPSTKRISGGLFDGMAFAVSYVSSETQKDKVLQLVRENGGTVLEDGFNALFESASTDLLPFAKEIGFTALIADNHSRRAKYIQALALGLPCLSGVWITSCVSKNMILDWSPYLLCAGQSTILNACRSRTLVPYPAATAKLVHTLAARKRFLDGKSVVLVTGKGKQAETRQAYVFIARILGPSRITETADLTSARKKLADSVDGMQWDIVYVDKDEEAAATILFTNLALPAGSRKRKIRQSETPEAPPKRVRVISDEVVVQSLIFGQLLDE